MYEINIYTLNFHNVICQISFNKKYIEKYKARDNIFP